MLGARIRATHVDATKEHPELIDQSGTLERWAPLVDDEGATWDDEHPVLRLDDGRAWIGAECWWTKAY
jgi:hypothetical protein